jgi:hypothetical protein
VWTRFPSQASATDISTLPAALSCTRACASVAWALSSASRPRTHRSVASMQTLLRSYRCCGPPVWPVTRYDFGSVQAWSGMVSNGFGSARPVKRAGFGKLWRPACYGPARHELQAGTAAARKPATAHRLTTYPSRPPPSPAHSTTPPDPSPVGHTTLTATPCSVLPRRFGGGAPRCRTASPRLLDVGPSVVATSSGAPSSSLPPSVYSGTP